MEVNTVLRRSELRLTTLACRSSNYCTDLVVANIFLRFVFLKYILYIYIFQMLVHVYILITLSLVKFISCASNTVHYKLCINYSTLQPAYQLQYTTNCVSTTVHYNLCIKYSTLQPVYQLKYTTNCVSTTVHYKLCINYSTLQTVYQIQYTTTGQIS